MSKSLYAKDCVKSIFGGSCFERRRSKHGCKTQSSKTVIPFKLFWGVTFLLCEDCLLMACIRRRGRLPRRGWATEVPWARRRRRGGGAATAIRGPDPKWRKRPTWSVLCSLRHLASFLKAEGERIESGRAGRRATRPDAAPADCRRSRPTETGCRPGRRPARLGLEEPLRPRRRPAAAGPPLGPPARDAPSPKLIPFMHPQ